MRSNQAEITETEIDMSMNIDEMSFEQALARLEAIVRMLESGNAALDESLSVFEEGIALVKMCNEKLEAAEQKVRILTAAPDGTVTAIPFKPTDSNG